MYKYELLLLSCGLSLAMFSAFGNSVNPDAVDLRPLPLPVRFESDIDRATPFDSTSKIKIEVAEPEDREKAVEWMNRKLSDWFPASTPKAIAVETTRVVPGGKEAYAIVADAAGVSISANSIAGVRYALYTIRQLAVAKRGTMRTEGYLLPYLRIEDFPALAFRALHLCWFPETTYMTMERSVRLAAFLRYNYVVVECWGTYESAQYKWFGWAAEKVASKSAIRRLVAIGKDLGITLVPQLNVWGHAALSGTRSLKHATLDLNPEYEPLFEPGGWNWCLTNPETKKILCNLIAELHDDFGKPPFFHIGCDEAQPPSCPECRRRPYGDQVCKHVLSIVSYIRSIGARTMMWHDMMLEGSDPRWQGFYAFGSKTTARLLDMLPSDVVVCDWQYKRPKDLEVTKWPTLDYLLSKLTAIVGCPWQNYETAIEQGRYVAEHGGYGLMQTTWDGLYGQNWAKMFSVGAVAAWGTSLDNSASTHGGYPLFNTRFANLLRMAGIDSGVRSYTEAGLHNHQLAPSTNWLNN